MEDLDGIRASDADDRPWEDYVKTDADVEDLEVVVVRVDRGACRLAGEPRALDDLADEDAEDGPRDCPDAFAGS